MTIEILNHYKITEDGNVGTFHARWKEAGLEFLGCQYVMKARWPSIILPSKKTKHSVTGKEIRYPLINFCPEKMAEVLKCLRNAFLVYAEANNIHWKKSVYTRDSFQKREYEKKPTVGFRPVTGKFKPFEFVDLPKPVNNGYRNRSNDPRLNDR